MYVTISTVLYISFFWRIGKQGEPYRFTHLIILSRVYHLSGEEESELAKSAPPRHSRPQGDSKPNKHKKQRPQEKNSEIQPPPDGIYSFHPEDDIIMKVSARFFFRLPCKQLSLSIVCTSLIDIRLYFPITSACTRNADRRDIWTWYSWEDDVSRWGRWDVERARRENGGSYWKWMMNEVGNKACHYIIILLSLFVPYDISEGASPTVWSFISTIWISRSDIRWQSESPLQDRTAILNVMILDDDQPVPEDLQILMARVLSAPMEYQAQLALSNIVNQLQPGELVHEVWHDSVARIEVAAVP